MAGMKNKTTKLIVKFNQQQLQLLDNLKKEGKFGENYAEIVVNVFREYEHGRKIRQTLPKKGV